MRCIRIDEVIPVCRILLIYLIWIKRITQDGERELWYDLGTYDYHPCVPSRLDELSYLFLNLFSKGHCKLRN